MDAMGNQHFGVKIVMCRETQLVMKSYNNRFDFQNTVSLKHFNDKALPGPHKAQDALW